MTPARLSLVDGSGYIFRAFYALQQTRQGGRNVQLSTSSGMPTGALHVFTGMLLKLVQEERPDLCAVVFDAEGKTFRHALDPEYKANRRETPPDLVVQFPWFERIVRALGLPVLKEPGVEADDVIATLARRARAEGLDVVIFSGDKDLMQLVDAHVTVVDAMREIVFDPARVTEKFGVPPERVGDWLALRGDSSDNVPGVDGIGDVTATKLLREWGSIDDLLAHVDEVKGKLGERLRDPVQRGRLDLSRRLVKLRDDVPLAGEIMAYRRRDWDAQALAELLRSLEFHRFAARLETTFVSERDRAVTILDVDALDRLIARCRESGELAVDTETTSLAAVDAHLVGVSIAVTGHPPAYVPVGHRYLGAPAQLDAGLVLDRLRPLLEDPAIAKVGQNHKYDWLVLARHGVEMRGVRDDPMLSSYVLDPSRPAHGLDELARVHLGHETIKYEEVCGRGKEQRSFAEVDVAAATRYSAEDAELALALARKLRPRVEAAGLAPILDEVELPLARILAIMERNGVRLDVPFLRALGQKVGEDCRALEEQVHALAGAAVNLQSPKQLGELLYGRLGLRSERMRKTTLGFSVDHEQLEELEGSHPIVRPILEHRELVKLKGTYLDALPPLVSPSTGRLHTSYSQAVAATGRLASMNPNIQNIPVRTPLGREIRRAFVADPGHLLLSADYSQIELRVLAHLSRDPVLVDAFARDLDVHAGTAAEVFGVPLAEVTPEQRRVAKAVNYGLGYGQTDFGLARALDIPRDEARRYIETYFGRFGRVRSFMDELLEQARRDGAVRTILGRRLPTPGLAAKRFPDRAAAERIARNAPIQGSAADILKLAMIRVQALLEGPSPTFRARMLLTVHDELVFEVPEGEVEEFGRRVRQEMEAAFALSVPLKVDVGVAPTWADAH